jgi:acyl-CoA synthetase (AMP-forming)/AMP-acid ligase II
MLSTMQDVSLTIGTIMRHACGINADRVITTAVGDGQYRSMTYGELGEQAGRLANALRGLGITGDQRVGTFMWNNAEHTVAYLAIPSMGAVLHTLNIRLSPAQIAYIADEAEDQVIIADLSLTAQLAPVRTTAATAASWCRSPTARFPCRWTARAAVPPARSDRRQTPAGSSARVSATPSDLVASNCEYSSGLGALTATAVMSPAQSATYSRDPSPLTARQDGWTLV